MQLFFVSYTIYNKEDMRTLLLITILLLSSCTKDDYCGMVTGGRIVMPTTSPIPLYILEVDGTEEYVNEKTYFDFRVGDAICLDF